MKRKHEDEGYAEGKTVFIGVVFPRAGVGEPARTQIQPLCPVTSHCCQLLSEGDHRKPPAAPRKHLPRFCCRSSRRTPRLFSSAIFQISRPRHFLWIIVAVSGAYFSKDSLIVINSELTNYIVIVFRLHLLF